MLPLLLLDAFVQAVFRGPRERGVSKTRQISPFCFDRPCLVLARKGFVKSPGKERPKKHTAKPLKF